MVVKVYMHGERDRERNRERKEREHIQLALGIFEHIQIFSKKKLSMMTDAKDM